MHSPATALRLLTFPHSGKAPLRLISGALPDCVPFSVRQGGSRSPGGPSTRPAGLPFASHAVQTAPEGTLRLTARLALRGMRRTEGPHPKQGPLEPNQSVKGAMKNRRFDSTEERLEAARDILDQGFEGIATDPETLARYLEFRAHFRTYSVRNTIMIMMQRSSARFCMGFRQWKSHGRRVTKGEKGLMIWVPRLHRLSAEEAAELKRSEGEKVLSGYLTSYVWDISQTEAIEGENALEYASPIPQLDGDGHEELHDQLRLISTCLGWPVEYTNSITEDGHCSYTDHKIRLRTPQTSASLASTLAHELVHAMCHTEGDGKSLSSRVKEIHAESAAFMVCYALGLDTSKSSLPYLKHWTSEDEPVSKHLETIDRISRDLLDLVTTAHATRQAA